MKKYADIPKENAQVLTPEESQKHLASLPKPSERTAQEKK